jgi:hypothetical protein
MTSTEARRTIERHGDTVPTTEWPTLSDETAEQLRALGCPSASPVAERRAS